MKRKRLGYIVIEACEDFEQPLGLLTDVSFPEGGLLIWTDDQRFVFRSKAEARKAIDRTDHYRQAFNADTDYPQKKFCKIVPVEGGV